MRSKSRKSQKSALSDDQPLKQSINSFKENLNINSKTIETKTFDAPTEKVTQVFKIQESASNQNNTNQNFSKKTNISVSSSPSVQKPIYNISVVPMLASD